MPAKTMHIMGCTPVRSGEKDGRTWTLYEVTACTPEGVAIDVPLRAFEDLPSGVGEFEVESREYQGEKQYTLKKAGAGGGGGQPSPGARLGPKVDELREAVKVLNDRITDVVARIVALEAVAKLDATPVADDRKPHERGVGSSGQRVPNAIFGGDEGAMF